MSTMRQLREGLSRAWDYLAEGWQELAERAGDALTRFHPVHETGELETADEQVMRNAARWGLLAAEVALEDDKVRVKLEAPGMDPENFEVSVVEDVLVVRGEKQLDREEQRGRYYVMERAYGHFERAIRLPVPVGDDRAEARYRKGVLHITLPRLEHGGRRRINVGRG